MSKENEKKDPLSRNKKRSFLEKIPSNLPFPKLIRRPDYQLRKIRLKVKHTSSINTSFFILLLLLGTFFIYIGGFYYLTTDQHVAMYVDPETQEHSVIWKNSLIDQTTFEGLAAGTLMLVGTGGCYLIHLSTQYSYSPNTAAKCLIIGAILVIISFVLLSMILQLKLEDFIEETKKPWPIRDF